MLLHGLGEGTEDNAHFGQGVFEGSGHRNRVEHRVHRHAGQPFLLHQRDAQLGVGFQQLRVHLVQAGQCRCILGGGIITDGLVINWFIFRFSPMRLFIISLQLDKAAVGFQTPLEHEIRLILFR